MNAHPYIRLPLWHGWTTYSILTGLLMILFVALYGATSAQHGALAGVFERL